MRAVVSFANTPFYQEKMKRLQESVEKQGIKFIGYKSFEEVGSPTHNEIPYAFKQYAIAKAVQDGVTTLLWVDSPIIAIKDISPVFEHIEKYGYLFFNNVGHSLGKWTNDKSLAYFGLTREQAMNIKMTMACCQGFRIYGEAGIFAIPFIDGWLQDYLTLAKEINPGSWDNHRHDQSLISLLIHKYNLKMLTAHETFFAYEHFKDVPGWKIADSVCLISR